MHGKGRGHVLLSFGTPIHISVLTPAAGAVCGAFDAAFVKLLWPFVLIFETTLISFWDRAYHAPQTPVGFPLSSRDFKAFDRCMKCCMNFQLTSIVKIALCFAQLTPYQGSATDKQANGQDKTFKI